MLSVYLDTDQSDPINVQRAFEVVFKNMLKNVEPLIELDGDARTLAKVLKL